MMQLNKVVLHTKLTEIAKKECTIFLFGFFTTTEVNRLLHFILFVQNTKNRNKQIGDQNPQSPRPHLLHYLTSTRRRTTTASSEHSFPFFYRIIF